MNVFHRISTHRARVAASHEIDPEDVFLDSQNLSALDVNQMQGQLEKPLPRHVFYIGSIAVTVLFFCFLYKIFSMQILHGKEYAMKADRNHLKSVPYFALRGTIVDRNSNLLAWNSSGNFVIGKDGSEKVAVDDIPRRVYVDAPGFSHLLGYVSYPKRDSSGAFWQNEYIGKDGLEKQFQTSLQGVKGNRVIAIDALGNIEAENVVEYPVHGTNLALSIDKDVQAKLYERIEALAHKAPFVAGAGVIMDVRNGEILAITSYPQYDNNVMTNAKTKEENAQVSSDLLDERRKFFDRAVSGTFTPGSTVKPFMAIAALMENVITPEQNIYSSGQLVVKNKYNGKDTIFRDWKAHGYTDMRKAIEESSDEYFYQVGGGYKDQKGLGIERINTYMRLFGFATTTGIDLPAEDFGVIPSPAWKKKIFNEDWLVGNTYHTSIGQYGFKVTALELVRAIAAIANNGHLVTPHVVLGATVASTTIALDAGALKVVQEGMHLVVHGDGGTAKALDIKDVDIAAKTGSAELGVGKEFVNSLITGYFPYNDPKYAFVIIMEKGSRTNTYGAVYAAREVIEFMRDYTSYTK